jgi:hypothetical protein
MKIEKGDGKKTCQIFLAIVLSKILKFSRHFGWLATVPVVDAMTGRACALVELEHQPTDQRVLLSHPLTSLH